MVCILSSFTSFGKSEAAGTAKSGRRLSQRSKSCCRVHRRLAGADSDSINSRMNWAASWAFWRAYPMSTVWPSTTGNW